MLYAIVFWFGLDGLGFMAYQPLLVIVAFWLVNTCNIK